MATLFLFYPTNEKFCLSKRVSWKVHVIKYFLAIKIFWIFCPPPESTKTKIFKDKWFDSLSRRIPPLFIL